MAGGLSSVIAAALSGLKANQTALETVSANIANANNPNYAAESPNFEALPGESGVAGVKVAGVTTAQVPLLEQRIDSASASQAFSQAWLAAGQSAQAHIANSASSTGSASGGSPLAQSLQSLFDSFATLAAQPSSTSARQAVLNAADNFAAQAGQLDSGLDQIATAALQQLPALVNQVNSLVSEAAALSSQIATSGGESSQSPSAVALRDQQKAISAQLTSLIGARIDPASGDVVLDGYVLSAGSRAFSLSLSSAPGSTSPTFAIELPRGSVTLPAGVLGGKIGGTVAGASAVVSLREQVDALVRDVAQAINAQNQAGFGLSGNPAPALFIVPASGTITVNPAIQPAQLGAASSASGVPGDGSNAAAIAALQNQAGIDPTFSASTPIAALSQIEASFGNQVADTSQREAQQQALGQALKQIESSVAGVSINQQLTMFEAYSNALGAAANVISAVANLNRYLLQIL